MLEVNYNSVKLVLHLIYFRSWKTYL